MNVPWQIVASDQVIMHIYTQTVIQILTGGGSCIYVQTFDKAMKTLAQIFIAQFQNLGVHNTVLKIFSLLFSLKK